MKKSPNFINTVSLEFFHKDNCVCYVIFSNFEGVKFIKCLSWYEEVIHSYKKEYKMFLYNSL